MPTFSFLVGGSLSDETAACLTALEMRYPGLSLESLSAASEETVAQSFAAYACLTDEEGERLLAGPGGGAADSFAQGGVPLTPSHARCVLEELGEEGLSGLSLSGDLSPNVMLAFAVCIGGMEGMEGGGSAMSDDPAEQRAAFIEGFAAMPGVNEESAACVADAMAGFGVPPSMEGLMMGVATAPEDVAGVMAQCGISPEVLQQLSGG